MADKITRDFWIVPGEVDKEGKTKEYGDPPRRVPGLQNTPVQVHEEMTPDGEYVQYRYDEASKRWVEFNRGVDKGRLDLYKTRRGDEPKPLSPDEARKATAEADLAEANARKANEKPKPSVVQLEGGRVGVVGQDAGGTPTFTPLDVPPPREPTINRGMAPTPGTNAAVDDPRSMTADVVSQAQADFDIKAAEARRQAERDKVLAAQQAEAAAIAKARLDVEQGQLTAQQARDKVNAELERIRLSLSAESNALTRRTQDITARGQDISAGVSQRGQDMDYAGRLAQSGTSLASAMLPYLNAPGQVESTNSLMAGGPPVPTKPVPPPFTPQLPLQLAQQAQQQAPQQYVLPPVPGQPPGPSQYVLRPTG